MNDYERMTQVIRYLDDHQIDQPDLDTLARLLNLSPTHFHQLFSRWAGVTPKNFLQCLTLTNLKRRLLLGNSVLEAALDVGLSGPGRAHDLCLELEAASLGEIKSGGAGWTLQWGVTDSPFGTCVLAEGPRGLCHLSFIDPSQDQNPCQEIEREWPQAKKKRENRWAADLAAQIFPYRTSRSGGLRPNSELEREDTSQRGPCANSLRATSDFGLKACVRGTNFQVRVWRALLQVPEGALVTYGALAKAIGQPGASRAVGSAVGSNPLSYLIPCHRVIQSTGITGQYRWGADRKKVMLGWEGETGKCPENLRQK